MLLVTQADTLCKGKSWKTLFVQVVIRFGKNGKALCYQTAERNAAEMLSEKRNAQTERHGGGR